MCARIKFANNEELVLKECDRLIPIVKYENDGKIFTSMHQTYEIWNHMKDGLIPSITEFVLQCEFFRLIDNEKVYKTTAVVSIENI